MGPHIIRKLVSFGHEIRVLDRDSDGLAQFSENGIETCCGDLADKIVWLYIADESSPIAVYKSTIADLGGVHYRITEQQMAAITEKYGLKGFPSYMIIGRDGSRDIRNDLNDTATAEKRLRAQLKK